ncbi:MAG: methyltransferase domain-containing protein [Verrucomicrobia bacterium]|nr:methyltransferase domain-containing protein [Verrucomicrobiota bacterium]
MKLNIGCGPSGLDGWLNFDWGVLPLLSKLPALRRAIIAMGLLPASYDARWPKLKLVDVRRGLPLENESVRFIYCSHVLEHFERWEALAILKECRRCLRKDGVMRIVVPDVQKLFSDYQSRLAAGQARAGRDLCRLWWGFDKDIAPASAFGRLARRFVRDHLWNYDRSELELLVKEAGFSTMTVCEFRKGAVPDLDPLDLEGHKQHSIYAEIS